MKISISPIEIQDNPSNKVTSDMVFTSRKIKDKNGNMIFHPDGIFSPRIFGKFGHCTCGKLKKPGYCAECDCRVINKKKMPDFYMEFNFDIPREILTISEKDKHKRENIEKLYRYKGFLYDGEYIDYDIKNDNSIYDEDKILYGKDAILSLGFTEEEYNNNVRRKITIPHTSFRKITIQGNTKFLGSINKTYILLLKQSKKFDSQFLDELYEKRSKLSKFNLLHKVADTVADLNNELFNIISENNKNLVDNELNGQPETGMIRAVLTNNFGLDEDRILIGYHFISTLYPYLYKKYTVNGETDIDAINKELKDGDYLVLFNRQPTIGAKSIIAMYPTFSKVEAEKFVIQANPIVYDGLAADVDGDSLNVIALYTKESCEEAKKLLPSVNYIEGSNSSIRNKLPEDFEYVKSLMTK